MKTYYRTEKDFEVTTVAHITYNGAGLGQIDQEIHVIEFKPKDPRN